MLLAILPASGAIIIGLVLLAWSADRFVEGASSIASHLGVSALIIGITIIGFGTSAPEILVSVIAVVEGTPDIAIGNALGSNIANIGLILGITALITPIPIDAGLLRREFPLLIIATAILIWRLADSALNRLDGLLLAAMLIAVLLYLLKSHRQSPEENHIEESLSESIPQGLSFMAAGGLVISGLVILVGSSKLLVWGATEIAVTLGVSELIIGLTVIAVGTSLPELAASIASLRKGVPDLAIGNVIGSNLFNSLAVIGLPALLASFSIDADAIHRDLPVVAVFTLLLFCFSLFPASSQRTLSRLKGFWLLGGFVIYQLYLYYEVMAGSA